MDVLDELPVGSILVSLEGETGEPSSHSPVEGVEPLVWAANEWSLHKEFFWPLEEWRDHFPYWDKSDILARRHIGDCYLMVAHATLTLGLPPIQVMTYILLNLSDQRLGSELKKGVSGTESMTSW